MRSLWSGSFLLALSLAVYCFLPQPLRDLGVAPPRRTEGSELDFTVSPWGRSLLKGFAADFIGNASEAAGDDWHLFFGVVIFHENVSYPIELSNDVSELQSELLDPHWETNFSVSLPDWPSSGLPRNTHEALQICNEWADHYTAVLLLTNGSASDWWSTVKVADELKEKEATIYAIGLDNASERTANRSAELLELATDVDTQLDVILPPPAHPHYTTAATTAATTATTTVATAASATETTTETTTESTTDTDTSTTSNSRRLSANLTAINIRDLASLLGLEVVEELTLLASLQTTTPASDVGTGGTGGTGGTASGAGLGGGVVVLIVLLSCCCTCSLIGIGFYFYKVDKARKSMAATKPTAVLPAPEPAQPITAVEAPPVPMDDTEQGLQEAIDARDLEKLSRWLSEVLLQGWPEPKYSDLILKALETVAQLKDSTRSALEQRLVTGAVGSLASARLVGLEAELLKRAEEVRGRDDVMS